MALPSAQAADIPGVVKEIQENMALALARNERFTLFRNYFKKTWLSTNGRYYTPDD